MSNFITGCSAFQRKDEGEEAYILKANATANKSSELDAYFAVVRTFYTKWCEDAAHSHTQVRG